MFGRSGYCLYGVWKLSGMSLEGVWKIIASFLDQVGIQSKMNSCKCHLPSWATKWHDYVPVDHHHQHHHHHHHQPPLLFQLRNSAIISLLRSKVADENCENVPTNCVARDLMISL